jgi:hypothetical protein
MLHGLIIPKCSPTSANFTAPYHTKKDSLPALSPRVHLTVSVIGHESLYPSNLYSIGYLGLCGTSTLYEKKGSTTLPSSTIISWRLAIVEMIERIFILILSLVVFRIIFTRWRNRASHWPYSEKHNGQMTVHVTMPIHFLAYQWIALRQLRLVPPTYASVSTVDWSLRGTKRNNMCS